MLMCLLQPSSGDKEVGPCQSHAPVINICPRNKHRLYPKEMCRNVTESQDCKHARHRGSMFACNLQFQLVLLSALQHDVPQHVNPTVWISIFNNQASESYSGEAKSLEGHHTVVRVLGAGSIARVDGVAPFPDQIKETL